MYYVINDLDNPSIDEDEDDAPFLEIHEELILNPKRGWHSGAILTDPPKKPIEIEATPYFGYQGPPPDYYDDAISLMSPRLAETLRKSGVYNFELFPAVISYRGTNEKYEWYAFNIIGLISAVDVSKSQIKNPDGELLINSCINGFQIDEGRTYGELMFRLAENVMVTVVHEQVKEAIQAAGINTFAFSEPSEWIQI